MSVDPRLLFLDAIYEFLNSSELLLPVEVIAVTVSGLLDQLGEPAAVAFLLLTSMVSAIKNSDILPIPFLPNTCLLNSGVWSFRRASCSDLQISLIDVLLRHSDAVIGNGDCVLAVVEENSNVLGVGVPRVRHDFGNYGRHITVEIYAQMIQRIEIQLTARSRGRPSISSMWRRMERAMILPSRTGTALPRCFEMRVEKMGSAGSTSW